jgi:hypothetical protein
MAPTHRGCALVSVTKHHHRQFLSADHLHHGLLMHNKVMIVDGATVITGSFNYTWSAEHRNAENLLVIHDPTLAAEYTQNWNIHAARSRPLAASAEGASPSAQAAPEAGTGPIVGNRRSMIYEWPNVSDRSIDYVRLHFAFEDRNGKVLDGESLYNHHAESLSDDAYVQKVLNEKPHFDPIRPGQSDTFRFSIPCSELPMFSKVEMFSDDIKR